MVVEKYDIADPVRTQAIMHQYRLQAQKSLGQNFLQDPAVIDHIITSAKIKPSDIILEVGPGIGSLTQQLAKSAKHVYAWEIDSKLLPILQKNLATMNNITIIEDDILQVDLEKFFQKNKLNHSKVKLVANLPYYITTPILEKFLQTKVALQQLVLMMQKEVAERVCAQPGHRAYGALSVAVQTKSRVQIVQKVPRTSFVPQPKVDSAVVDFDLTAPLPVQISDYSSFMKFVEAIFRQKRKTLWNNLLTYIGKTTSHRQQLEVVFDYLDYSHNIRAEQLSIEQIVKLQDTIQQNVK